MSDEAWAAPKAGPVANPVAAKRAGPAAAAAAEARRALGWLPWLFLALAWFACVQLRPLLDPDEGRYAEVPREMVQSGDWVTPRLDGVHYFEKPPLQYWATAAAYRVFGQSEWTARLWTVGLAFLCLPMVYGWAARLGADRRAGLAALVALATSPLFVLIGHLNMLDAGFTFWLSAALCAFTLAQRPDAGEQIRRRWMLAAWAAAALAVLTKGIVVGVLFGASLLVYCLLERDARLLRRLQWRDGLLTFLALAAPWFLWVSLRNPGFASFFFVHEHFTRFLTKVHHHGEPWWYFLPVLLVGVLPWVLPLAHAARRTWLGAAAEAPAGQSAELKPLKFLLVFAGVTLVFFSLSGSKLPPYILPMLPPLAVIAGVHAAASPGFFRRAARWGAGFVALSAAGLLWYCVHRNGYIPEVVTLWTGASLAAAFTAAVFTWPQRELPLWAQGTAPALATAAAAVIAWQALLNAYTFMPAVRSARDLVAAVRPYVHPGTALYSVGQYRETIPPYLKRSLAVVDFQGELEFPQDQAEPVGSGQSGQADPGGISHADFTRSWSVSRDAVAFFDPKVWDRYHRAGFPGRVVAADAYTVAVVRS